MLGSQLEDGREVMGLKPIFIVLKGIMSLHTILWFSPVLPRLQLP